MTEQNIPQVGQVVKAVTVDYVEVDALVTAVHGTGYEVGGVHMQPLINVVYVSPDAEKRDSYGRQIMRDLTSLQHYSATEGMPRRGRYWQFR